MSVEEFQDLTPRVLTPEENDVEQKSFRAVFSNVPGKALYGALQGLTSAVNACYNETQKTDLPVDAQRLNFMPSMVVKVVKLCRPNTKEKCSNYEVVLGKDAAGYLSRSLVGLEQGINMVLNLQHKYGLPYDEKAWKTLIKNVSPLHFYIDANPPEDGCKWFVVKTVSSTVQSLCTRLCNLVEYTIERTYSDVEHGSLLPDKYVSKDTPSLDEAYGIPSALLEYRKTSGKSEPEVDETDTEAESNDFEEREVMSVEDFEDIECVEEPENAEPEGLEEETGEADGSLWDDDGRLLRIPTEEECAQLLQEMEVEAKEAEEGEGAVYFDVWSFSGDDEDEIPVRNPLTPPLPPRVFGNAKDGYLPSNVFNAFKE